mgnify:CR=1 FL=1
MSEYTKYLKWISRRKLLRTRGEEMNRGIISKLSRKIEHYRRTHQEP